HHSLFVLVHPRVDRASRRHVGRSHEDQAIAADLWTMPFGKEFRVLFDPGAEKCLIVVRRLRDGLCTDENRAEIRFGLVFYVRIGADRDVGSTRMRYLSATYSALL